MTETTTTTTPTSNRPITLVFITLLIDVLGLGIIIPIMPDLLHSLGIESVPEQSRMGGWLIVAYALPQFLFSPVMGGLSDRYGRRPVLLISLVGLGIDYVFHALAPTVAILFVSRAIAGLCGASFTTGSSYIADISAPEKRSQNFGLIGVAFGIGFILGPLIGGYSAELWGTRAPFWVAAALSFLNAAMCYFLLPESLAKENRRKFEVKRANPVGTLLHMRKYHIVLKLMIPLFLVYLAAHAVQSNWAFYTKYKFQWDEGDIGLSLSIVGIAIAIVQGGLVRFLIPKLGNEKAILYGFIFNFAGMLLFGLATQTWMMYAIIPLYCLGGIAGPALQGTMSLAVPNTEQGELSGGMTSMMSITSIFGPLIMNNTFAYFTEKTGQIIPGAPMFLGALFILISIFFIYSIFHSKEGEILHVVDGQEIEKNKSAAAGQS